VIRQAISCDICGAEKKQTNHWFVAYEQTGELRVSGWNSRNRLRTGSKHLCGQACLHKLADDFMARVIGEKAAARSQAAALEEPEPEPVEPMETSAPAAPAEIESSARLVAPPPVPPRTPLLPRPVMRPAALVTMPVAMPDRALTEGFGLPPEEPPRYASRNWRAEAWERERERAMRAGEHRPEIVARKISQA